jgi:hypothetical protein
VSIIKQQNTCAHIQRRVIRVLGERVPSSVVSRGWSSFSLDWETPGYTVFLKSAAHSYPECSWVDINRVPRRIWHPIHTPFGIRVRKFMGWLLHFFSYDFFVDQITPILFLSNTMIGFVSSSTKHADRVPSLFRNKCLFLIKMLWPHHAVHEPRCSLSPLHKCSPVCNCNLQISKFSCCVMHVLNHGCNLEVMTWEQQHVLSWPLPTSRLCFLCSCKFVLLQSLWALVRFIYKFIF